MSGMVDYTVHFSLNGVEAIAFDKYVKQAECSTAAGVICLIREFLLNKPYSNEDELFSEATARTLDSVERELKHLESVVDCLCGHDEKLDEKIAFIEQELSRLAEANG